MQPQLTPEQYEIVLKYIEATSEDDFQTATAILRQYNFNLNTAINAKFNHHEPRANRHHNPNNRMENQANDDQIVRKYIQFVQKQIRDNNIISSTLGFVKNFTVGLVKFIAQIILPQSLLRKILRSKFYSLYKDQVKVNIQDDKLLRLLHNTQQKSYKSCIVVISPANKADCIVELLNRNEIVKKIQESFFFIGFVAGDTQIDHIGQQRPPEILICRYNIYKQFQIITRLTGQTQIRQLTLQQLQNSLQLGRNMHKQDKNVLVKYRNFIRRQYYGGQMQMVQEEQEQEVNFLTREEDTQHIRMQNQEYQKMAQQEIKREEQRKIEQERIRKQSLIEEQKQEERKCRKLSIPDEPQSGEIIRFSFRCPDGTNINRAFLSQQKVQILYHWVETNEEIELEDNKKRQFEIMYSYPPTALSSQKEKLLKEVFESDQEKLLIREL